MRKMTFARDPNDWMEQAARCSDRLFLRTPEGRNFSYADLREHSGRIASVLLRRGVQSGDRVAVQVDKSAEAVFLYVACLRMGAVFVPINVANTPNEVEYFLRDSQPRAAIVRPQDRMLIESLARNAKVAWVETLAADGTGSLPLLASEADPIHPMRVYGELAGVLDDDAVVIGDGGDFVSYAGKYIEPGRPGGWLDPGPYGCLGTGLGYAIAARLARPSDQVVLLLGDGAAGFSLMDADTLVRHGLPVVMVCGNNGIWGLEKHPMQAIYGYDVVADYLWGRPTEILIDSLTKEDLEVRTLRTRLVQAGEMAGSAITLPGSALIAAR